MELFFVYGTLKAGQGNHGILGNSARVGTYAKTCNNYTLYNLGCPGAVPYYDGLPILGELYEVYEDSVVRDLDRLEGNGHFYTRQKRDVIVDGKKLYKDCWIYELPDTRWGMAGYCPEVEVDGEIMYVWRR